jgi:hypothetical protein
VAKTVKIVFTTHSVGPKSSWRSVICADRNCQLLLLTSHGFGDMKRV